MLKRFDFMKNVLLLLAISTLIIKSESGFSQVATEKTIFNCSANLVLDQFNDSEIVMLNNISYAKPGGTNIAPDPSYVDDCIKESTCSKDGSDLKYDIYYPATHDYPGCALPIIFLIHPGGFSECSNKEQLGMDLYCKEFAKRGFIAVNVEYRRGRVMDASRAPDNRGKTSASYMLSLYRAFQDLRGAIKSMIQMQNNGEFPGFSFDQNNIFVGGAGTTAMNVAYYNQEMMDMIVPDMKNYLGSINADFYYGDSTINYSIKGVLNLWGVMVIPFNPAFQSYFTNPSQPLAPIIMFHGSKDNIADYYVDNMYYSDAPYNTDNTCLLDGASSYTIKNPNKDKPDLQSYGSLKIYQAFKKQLRVPCELYVDCGMRHGLETTSGFGLNTTDKPTVQKYIVQRATTFFQAVVNNKASSIKASSFFNCQNYRSACIFKDNNDNCSSELSCRTKTALAKSDAGMAPTEICTIKKNMQMVHVSFFAAGASVVEIFNTNGTLIKTQKGNALDVFINVSDLKQDVYFIKVTQQGKGTQAATIGI